LYVGKSIKWLMEKSLPRGRDRPLPGWSGILDILEFNPDKGLRLLRGLCPWGSLADKLWGISI
jgi:hypothetical protein